MDVFARVRAAAALCCLLSIVSGCAGGEAPLAPAAPGAGASHHGRGQLALRIRIPRRRHHRSHYVSAATKALTITLVGPVTRVEIAALTPSSPGCSTSNGNTTCNVDLDLPAGSYTAAVATYDAAPVNGSIPQSAHELSSASGLFFTVTTGRTNAANFTLSGVVSSLSITNVPGGSIGNPLSAPFTVTAKDPDGYTIVGPYDVPVFLSVSSGASTTSIATSGADNPPLGGLISSSDVATLHYTGYTMTTATLVATATNIAPANATFAPASVAPVLTGMSTMLVQAGNTVSETLTGANFGAIGTSVAVSGTGVSVQNVVVVSPTQLSASFVAALGATYDSRNVTVTTESGTSNAQILHVATLTVTVTNNSDGNAGGGGIAGDLRYMIVHSPAGTLITFNCGNPCIIALNAPLQAIDKNLDFDGGTFGNVVIDGSGLYRAFFVDDASVYVANLQIQHVLAQGGIGGGSNGATGCAGGGGAGLGAGLFVNQAGAQASVVRDYFVDAAATGGSGGAGLFASGTITGNGGGGGLAYNGGNATGTSTSGGGGGGGVQAIGSDATSTGGAGGFGGGGGGGNGGAGGTAYGTNSAGSTATSGAGSPGAAGGFGGGGGGGAVSGDGGTGGFGAGGGGGSNRGGAGGVGGGGGGSFNVIGSGGSLGPLGGGNGDDICNAGGGAAAGPAIFVNAGALTTVDSGASNASASPGAPSGGTATAGGADATPVFNYAGTVNLSATTGPIAGALSGTTPSLRHHLKKRN